MAFMAKIKHWLRMDLEHSYISPADKFLQEFDKAHPQKSFSQLFEIERHRRVARLRDHVQAEKSAPAKVDTFKIWDKF